MFFVNVFRRAFAANPNVVPATAGENSVLEANGIHQPTVQNYLAWRRSLMVFVVFATLAETGCHTIGTGRKLTIGSISLNLIAKHLPPMNSLVNPLANPLLNLPIAPPVNPLLLPALQKAKEMLAPGEDAEAEEEDPADAEDSTEKKASATPPKVNQSRQKAIRIRNPMNPSQKRPERSWISSMTCRATLFPWRRLVVVLVWTRFHLSFQIMVATFLFSFVVPLVLAFCPWSWWGYTDTVHSPDDRADRIFARPGGRSAGSGNVPGDTLADRPLAGSRRAKSVHQGQIAVAPIDAPRLVPRRGVAIFMRLFLLVIFIAISQVDSNSLFSSECCYFCWPRWRTP